MRILSILSFCLLISCQPSVKIAEEEVVIDKKEQGEKLSDAKINLNNSNWSKTSVEKLDAIGFLPQFTMDGSQFIYTSQNNNGIWIFDTKAKSTRQISDKAGAGYLPVIVGNKIIYQTGRKRLLEAVDIKSGIIEEVEEGYKTLSPIEYQSALENANEGQNIFATTSDDLSSIVINIGKEMKALKPQGEKNYFNVSLSPNREMILYQASGLGAFIINKNGIVLAEIGKVDTPSWVNDENLLYAKSMDDGHQILSSEIVVYNIESEKEYVISADIDDQLVNPGINRNGNIVVAHSPNGDLYLIRKDRK